MQTDAEIESGDEERQTDGQKKIGRCVSDSERLDQPAGRAGGRLTRLSVMSPL